jgi:hypothetical protein
MAIVEADLKLTCEAKTGFRPGRFGFEPLWCHQWKGLRSLTDGRGELRWFCPAIGHERSVVNRFGRAVATDDDHQPESADGITSFKVEREKEWIQDHGGYVLVADEAD